VDEEGGKPARGDEGRHGHGGAVAQRAEERAHDGACAELQGAEEGGGGTGIPALRAKRGSDHVRQHEAETRDVDEERPEHTGQTARPRPRHDEQDHPGGGGDHQRVREDAGARHPCEQDAIEL